jgi:adenosylmethionine-8-amino-7-oxononanoate aminotransferase
MARIFHRKIGHSCGFVRAAGDATRQSVREYLSRRLKERFGNHPFVGDVRGRGLFQGLELVARRDTNKPFDPKLELQRGRSAKRSLIVYPMGGTVDGVAGDHLSLAPPFIVDEPLIDTIVERLGDAIDAAAANIS